MCQVRVSVVGRWKGHCGVPLRAQPRAAERDRAIYARLQFRVVIWYRDPGCRGRVEGIR